MVFSAFPKKFFSLACKLVKPIRCALQTTWCKHPVSKLLRKNLWKTSYLSMLMENTYSSFLSWPNANLLH